MKVFVENNNLFSNAVKYIFNVFAKNKNLNYKLVDLEEHAELIIGTMDHSHIKISIDFYNKLKQKKYSFSHHFNETPYIKDASGSIDFLSTAFYMINCIQEIDSTDLDVYGRFKFENSYQKKYGVEKENLVQKCFDSISEMIDLKFKNIFDQKPNRSRIFLSHDIDTIHGSLMQDGFYAMKKLRPDLMLNVFLKNIIERPYWFSIDRIMKIESDNDFHSTFYWLVNKGKVNEHLSNSDYNFKSDLVQKKMNDLKAKGWENGLHKSAAETSFKNELDLFPFEIKGNRYHYLKFSPQNDFKKIEESGIKFDTSLGFAESLGFRNSYGAPYHPYNFVDERKFDFVECPLHIMDTTFYNYMKTTSEVMLDSAIKFVEKHNSGCVISVLFHNNFISEFKYGSYLNTFKKLLLYFYENDFKSIDQSEIIEKYYEH